LEHLSLEDKIRELQKAMRQAASNLEFEKAAYFRDELAKLVKKTPDKTRQPNTIRGKKR
jgi:excinuclease UvrABC helicase subunit UvrB